MSKVLESTISIQQKVADLNKQVEHFLLAIQDHIITSTQVTLGEILKQIISLMEIIKTEMHQLVLKFGEPVNPSIQIVENNQYYISALKATLGEYMS
jgi:hypothetical protein